MQKRYKIFFSAEQAGGLDALLPAIERIKNNKKFVCVLFLGNESVYGYAKGKNIKKISLTAFSFSAIKKIIKEENPDLVFTDTSEKKFGLSVDKKFVVAARQLRKPTMSIVDSWMNYEKRFGEKLEFLPDNILVIDEEMKDDLRRVGVKKEMIKITGNPRFDKFLSTKKAKETKNLIIFNSQPIPKKENLNEVKIFKDIMGVLEKIRPYKKVVITFHPTREADPQQRKKYDDIIRVSKLSIRKGKKTGKLNEIAELVTGIYSIALFDASLAGKKVLSYQPGKNIKNDKLQSNRYGWSTPVYKKEHLSKAVENILRRRVPVGIKQRSEYTRNRSAEKVVKLIEETLK